MSAIPKHNPRLLSIDGGGVRGLSSLLILKQLMETIDPNAEHPPKPCEYFDMIGGTSTGGLIAIMLGRLQMDIDSCIDAYLALSDRIFHKRRQWINLKGKTQGVFDSEELERAIKQILVQQGCDPDELLRSPGKTTCKVDGESFVCAASRETNSIVLFRSYGGRGVSRPIRIWQAGRATSAAPTFFDPITIGAIGETFQDGAMGANNPIFHLWSEALYEWPGLEATVQCVVSIGTGVVSATPFKDDVLHILPSLARIVTECDATAERFLQDKRTLDDQKRYYRFNVEEGLGDVAMEDSKQKPFIAAATNKYIETHRVFKALQDCASMLKLGLCYEALASKDSLSRFEDIAIFNDAQWLFQHDVYRSWVSERPKDEERAFLTLKGNPGAGKSVLMKQIVLATSLDTSAIVISYFFNHAHGLEHQSASQTHVLRMCRSILGQLILRAPEVQCISSDLSVWGEDMARRNDASSWLINQLTIGELRDKIVQIILSNRLNALGQSLRFRIFVDGMNGCEGDHQECVSWRKGSCQLWIMTVLSQLLDDTLCEEADIGVCMSRQYVPMYGDNEPSTNTIEIDKHNKDSVQAFIKNQLQKLRNHDRELRLYLQLQAHVHDGFLWATLVTQEILDLSTSEEFTELAAVLSGIPRGLRNIYERALYKPELVTSSRMWDFFKVALGALRPMTSKQFRQAFAFMEAFGHDSIEKWENSDTGFHPDRFTNRLRRDSRGLLEITILQKRLHIDGSSCETHDQVRFIHGSVVKFLRKECDFTKLHPDLSTNMTEQCHLFLFKCCMNALDFYSLRHEHNVDFLDYACEFWAQHARAAGHLLDSLEELPKFILSCNAKKTPRVLRMQRKLLGASQAKEFLLLESCETDASGSMIAVLATLGCDNLLRRHFKRCKDCRKSTLDLHSGTGLGPYELALRNSIIGGWTDVASYLIEERCKGDLNTHVAGRTLLFTACYFRDLPVVDFLLRQKADASAWSRAKYEYPLHVAIELGATELVKLLLGSDSVDKNAVLTARRTHGGGTALHCAIQSRQPQAKKLEVLKMIIKLAPKGAKLLALTDNAGKTPIDLARHELGEDSKVLEELEDFEDEDEGEDESGDESESEGEHSDGEEA